MTAEIRNTWKILSRVLTIINLTLLMILTFQGFDYKEVWDKKIPIAANIALLIVLGLAVFAAIYQLL